MTAIRPPIRAPRKVSGSPLPAARNAREDRGQRKLETKSVSGLSDVFPAGQTRNIPRKTLRSSDSEARNVAGRGVAVSGGSPASVQPRDSTFADVPAKEMEPHDGSPHHAIGTVTRREVSLDVRLTKGEREKIRARARVLGVKPSAWARAVMFDALDARNDFVASITTAATTAPDPALAGAVEQLRRVGVNLNTTLRKGQTVDAGLLRTVSDAVSEVRASLGDRTRL